MKVVFVAGRLCPLPERPATNLAENLRITAAEHVEGEGGEGALAVANAIETVLVGDSADPILLDADEADAVYYSLDKNSAADEPGPLQNLYLAVSTLHHARLEARDS